MNPKFEISMLVNAGITFERDILCSKLTTFRTGGPCAVVAKARSSDQLNSAVALCRQTGMRYKIIGAGSNLLVSDKGFNGMMIRLTGNFRDITIKGTEWTVGAGISLPGLCRKAAEFESSGLEFAAGIPGTVGGAIWMNAGAWDSEMGKVAVTITVFNPATGEVLTRYAPFSCGYRRGPFVGTDLIVMAVGFTLPLSDKEKIEDAMREFELKRKSSQPVGVPSAGSVFKNPEGGQKAWELIDRCGLRGERMGGAVISEKHPNFILNEGGASSLDIYKLIQKAREAVLKKTGIGLVPEIEFVGEF